MIFTKAGIAIAWICVVLGILHLGYLMSFAFQSVPPAQNDPIWLKINAETRFTYMVIGFGVVLGILAEISKTLAGRAAQITSRRTD